MSRNKKRKGNTVYLRGKYYNFNFMFNGKRYHYCTFTDDLETAIELENEAREKIKNGYEMVKKIGYEFIKKEN